MPDIPVAVLGGGGVGKSCLTIQYAQGHFVEHYDATIEDVYRKLVHLDGTPAVLTIVDTAGQDAFGVLRDQYLKKCSGFVLVYSITDIESLHQVQRICANLQRVRVGRSTPCVLVGNKVDQDAYRAVGPETGSQLAAEIGATFMEITARDHRMCDHVFDTLARSIRSDVTTAASAGAGEDCAAASAGASSGAPRTSATAEKAGEDDGSTMAKKKRRQSKCSLL